MFLEVWKTGESAQGVSESQNSKAPGTEDKLPGVWMLPSHWGILLCKPLLADALCKLHEPGVTGLLASYVSPSSNRLTRGGGGCQLVGKVIIPYCPPVPTEQPGLLTVYLQGPWNFSALSFGGSSELSPVGLGSQAGRGRVKNKARSHCH